MLLHQEASGGLRAQKKFKFLIMSAYIHLRFLFGCIGFGRVGKVSESGNRDTRHDSQNKDNHNELNQCENCFQLRTVYQLFSLDPLVLAQTSPVAALYAHPPRVPTMVPFVTPVTIESAAESEL